jgi:hypothetical protein
LCNIGSANPTQMNRRLAAVVLADKLGPVPVPVTSATPLEIPLPPASLRELAGVYVDTTRAATRIVVYRDSTRSLHLSNATNAPRLVPVGNDEFAIAGNPGRLRFLRAREVITGLVDVPATRVFVRMPGAVTTAEALAAFEGRYRSDELDTEWVFTASPRGLVLGRSRFPDRLLEPEEALGMFRTGIGIVLFTHDGSGAVTGFSLTGRRSWNLHFDRIRVVR